jgi:hypothetical protein
MSPPASTSLANWITPTGQPIGGGCLAFGRVWVTYGGQVHSFDQLTGAAGPSFGGFGLTSNPSLLAPYGDMLCVANQDNQIYTIDVNGDGTTDSLAFVGQLRWMAPFDDSLLVAGANGFYRVASPDEGVDTQWGPLVGPYGRGSIDGHPALGGGVAYVPLTTSGSTTVTALDAQTVTRLWSASADGRVVGGVTCDGTRLAFATANRSLLVFDLNSRAQLATFALSAPAVARPVIDGERCIVALSNSLVDVLDISRAASPKTFQLTEAAAGDPVVSETGTIFFPAPKHIFAVDPHAGSAGGVISYPTGATATLLDHRDGALFYAESTAASAVRLDEQIHAYYAESTLIRDFEFSAGGPPTSSTPNFQVDVTVLQDDGSPRSGQSIRVFSTAPTTIGYLGADYRCTPAAGVDVKTDGAGRLRLAVPAGTPDDGGTFRPGLAAPELLLSAPFMDPKARLVVRPHGELQSQLATIDADQLSGAKGYDGSYVVTDAYRGDETAMGNVAQAINQTASMARGSMTAPRKRGDGAMYCDPACDAGTVCCLPANATRLPCLCTQAYAFDLTLGTSSFSLLSADQARSLASTRQTRSWLGDLWDDIKTGAARVVGAIVSAVNDVASAVITAIKDGVESVVTLVLDTLEKAALLIQGIFNTIATAIAHVIEAVSFLFDWDAILALHTEIATRASAAWSGLAAGTGPVTYAQLKAQLSSLVATGKGRIDEAFEAAVTALGARSAVSAQAEASGKGNAAVGSSQENWLLGKFQDQAVGGTAPTAARSARGVGDAAISWPTFDPPDSARAAFAAFTARVASEVGGEVSATIDRVWADLDFSSDPGILARSMAAVLDVLRGLVDVGLAVTGALIELAIDLLAAMANAFASYVTSKLEIPYLSDLYRWITGGEDLTLLNLFSLLVAVPAGFASRLIPREPAYASGVAPAPRGPAARSAEPEYVLEIIAGAGQVLWGLLSGTLAAIDAVTASPQTLADSGLRLISVIRIAAFAGAFFVIRGLYLAALIASGAGILAYVLWFFPTAVIVADAAAIKWSREHKDTTWLVVTFAASFGVILALLAIVPPLSSERDIHAWLAFAFGVAAGLAMLCRVATVTPDLKLKLGGIAASSFLLVCSGAFTIADGAVSV